MSPWIFRKYVCDQLNDRTILYQPHVTLRTQLVTCNWRSEATIDNLCKLNLYQHDRYFTNNYWCEVHRKVADRCCHQWKLKLPTILIRMYYTFSVMILTSSPITIMTSLQDSEILELSITFDLIHTVHWNKIVICYKKFRLHYWMYLPASRGVTICTTVHFQNWLSYLRFQKWRFLY